MHTDPQRNVAGEQMSTTKSRSQTVKLIDKKIIMCNSSQEKRSLYYLPANKLSLA